MRLNWPVFLLRGDRTEQCYWGSLVWQTCNFGYLLYFRVFGVFGVFGVLGLGNKANLILRPVLRRLSVSLPEGGG
jgi:hypothetical protein